MTWLRDIIQGLTPPGIAPKVPQEVVPAEPVIGITLAEFYMGRDVEYANELTLQIRIAAVELLSRVNPLLRLYGKAPAVNSGWRPVAVNAAMHGAPNSRHLVGKAVDLDDDDGALAAWCLRNLDALATTGLWLEQPSATPGWVHLQSEAPASGNRVFNP